MFSRSKMSFQISRSTHPLRMRCSGLYIHTYCGCLHLQVLSCTYVFANPKEKQNSGTKICRYQECTTAFDRPRTSESDPISKEMQYLQVFVGKSCWIMPSFWCLGNPYLWYRYAYNHHLLMMCPIFAPYVWWWTRDHQNIAIYPALLV